MRSLRDVAIQDQLEAATAEARGGVDGIKDAMGLSFIGEGGFLLSWMRPPKTVCPHIGEMPRVVLALIRDPEHFMCGECLLPAAFASTMIPTCDSCDKPTDRFVTSVVQRGPVIYIGEICKECQDQQRSMVKEEDGG